MAAAFVPARFEALQRTILGAVASPARVAGSNEWYVALDRARNELVDFARPRPPSEAERREIEGGECGMRMWWCHARPGRRADSSSSCTRLPC